MARKGKGFHFIYKTTNILSGRYYIGMHSTNNLEDGYLGSGTRLRYSINRYGEENHKREILEFCNTRNKLKEREKEIVSLNEIAKKECLNLKVGGIGGWTSEQQILNAIKSNKKQRFLRETNTDWWENKKKAIGRGNKLSYKKGRKIKVPNWIGRKHKEETKRKLSESKIGTGRGILNSQYGTCWITNGKENRKIYKGKKIPKGYKLGRKI